MKVVIGTPFGFHLNRKAIDRLIELGVPFVKEEKDGAGDFFVYESYFFALDRREKHVHDSRTEQEKRTDPLIVRVAEEIGPAAGLKVYDIPDDVEWEIIEGNEGEEWIAEKHRRWGREDEGPATTDGHPTTVADSPGCEAGRDDDREGFPNAPPHP